MKAPNYIVFSRDIEGHYKNWEKVLERLIYSKCLNSTKKQLFYIFKSSTILFLDGDKIHLLYLPLIFIRNIFGLKSVLFSIRTEKLLEKSIKSEIKRKLFSVIKLMKNTRIISIHKFSQNSKMAKYVNDFIYDVQYWDLPLLNITPEPPPEINCFKTTKPVLLVLGALNEKRCKNELLAELEKENNLNYVIIFAGKIEKSDHLILSKNRNCHIINRYIDDSEYLYLLEISDVVYCFYNSDRPSGIFGRAFQLGKYVLVKKDGYLHKYHPSYKGLIVVESLNEFNLKINNVALKPFDAAGFRGERTLIRILNSLENPNSF